MSLLRRFFPGNPHGMVSSEGSDAKAVGVEPSRSEDRNSVGPPLITIAALGREGRFADAYAVACSALERMPDHPELLFAKATALLDNGRFEEARTVYEQLDRFGHSSTVLAVQLAWACHRLGDNAAAEESLRKAIAADPAAFKPHYSLGSLIYAQKRHREAVMELERAVAIAPDDLDTRTVLGNVLMELGEFSAAEVHYRRGVEIAPERAGAWTNVGFALVNQDCHDEGIRAFEHAHELERRHGGDTDAYVNFGVALADDGRLDEALAVFNANLSQRPAAKAHWNYAVTLLRSGRLAEGWANHEFRLLLEPLRSLRPDYGVPAWAGQDLRGKTLLIRAEQGLGDTIQMLRYVPALAALGARVLLRAPPGFELLALGVNGIAEVLKQGAVNPPFDYYIHAMSLPGVFGTTLTTIPADVPYIGVDPVRRERWGTRLGTTTKRSVGLVWAGSPVHVKDRYRSTNLKALLPLLQVENVRFVSLQKGPLLAEIAEISNAIDLVNLGPELEDLADTAAVIAQLDLVIGVDTAVVHLAGALAKPVWTMVARPSDWRWLEERDDSPWYPTLRIYRQSRRNEWDDVIARLAADLAAWVRAPAVKSEVKVAGSPNVPMLVEAKLRPPCTLSAKGISAVAETRWGILQYLDEEPDIAASVAWYGEWLEPQISLLARILHPGATVVEIGAGAGAHTLALAAIVGKSGRVYACESRAVLRRLLRQNLEANLHANVALVGNDPARPAATDLPRGIAKSSDTLDAMRIDRLALLKTAPGVRSKTVLDGGADTLWRLRPILSLAAVDARELAEVTEHVKQFGYRCWRMETPLFNPDNFNRRTTDIFGGRSAITLLAIPEEVDLAMTLIGCTAID